MSKKNIKIPVITRSVLVNPDSPSSDAFGRLRTSETGNRLDVEFIYDKQINFFDEITNSGLVTLNSNTRDLTLSLQNDSDGSFSTMRSHPVPYTPGNSQLVEITGILNPSEIPGGSAETFLRTSTSGTVTEEVVHQSSWFATPNALDFSKAQIFAIDFQSLKVGRIRYFFVMDGTTIQVSEILNDNRKQSGYWQFPSLPVYWRIYNDATHTNMEIGYGDEANAVGFRYKVLANAAATIRAICCTVKSEGGDSLQNIPGIRFSADLGITGKTVSTTLIPIISIRQKSTFNTFDNLSIAIPRSLSISTTNPIRLVVLYNNSLTGASWVSPDAESSVEYDITASDLTGGRVVNSEYISSLSGNRATSASSLIGKPVLWSRKSTEPGILTVAAIRTESQDAGVLASIQWDEIR